MTEYLSHADTNKLIRKALKEAFPTVKFSVTKSGGSTYIKWTDGPTKQAVDKIAALFQGATFDSMTDYRGGQTHTMEGREVHFGADFVFCTRELSEAFIAKALAEYDARTPEEQCDLFNDEGIGRVPSWYSEAETRRAIAYAWPSVKAQHSPTAASIAHAHS